jgi:hypothetical protein
MEQSDLNLLQNVPSYHLQAVIKSRRGPIYRAPDRPPPPETSSMNIVEVAHYLFNPSASLEMIRDLDETEQLILRELVVCGGRANSRDLALYLTRKGLLNPAKSKRQTRPLSGGNPAGVSVSAMITHGPPQYPIPHPHGIFEQALRHLLLLGLVFWSKQTNIMGQDYASGVYDGVLLVPRAVMDVVNDVVHGELRAKEADRAEMPEEDSGNTGASLETIQALQRTLYLYWSLVVTMRDGLSLVSNKLLSRPALRQVVERLNPAAQVEQIRSESDVPHLQFIRLLLMSLGLLVERQGALYPAPSEHFFALPLIERAHRCYHLWLETPFWNELAYLPDVVVRPGPVPLDPAHEEVILARQVIVERLLHEQPGVWHELSTFIARTKLYAPYLLFPRQYGSRADRYSMGSNPYGWDFRLRRGWLMHREGWHMVEGGFIRSVVLGPLHWLGLVELDSENHPEAFRFGPRISLITSDVAPVVEEPPPGRLIVQPNFEVVALAPVSESLLVNLDRFADCIRLERIAQYRLTRASVTRAIQMGLHADTIAQILEQAAGAEIPQNVQYSLLEWERQARRIELWRGATLLEVDDPVVLDALFADEKTRLMLGRRLAPMLAEVTPHHLAAIQEALWRRDYLPALSSTPSESPLESGRLPVQEPQWRLLEDGLMRPCYPIPDFYLAAELEQISELDEETGWRKITPSAIAQACSSGVPLEHILRFLQNYCAGGLPTSFLIRLKLWGGGYGEQHTIGVEDAPLLLLSAEILQDLLADEVVGPLLGAEVPQGHRLVRVPQSALEDVVALLKERGFEVE